MNRAPLVVAILVGLAFHRSVSARLMQSWSYQELFTKSDVVVIAKPRAATRDTTERSTLRDIAVPVIGVATEFQTLLVLKGRTRERFSLHHYRLREPDLAFVNGPSLISFDPKKDHRRYLLFLVRESDGRFAPVAGQTDLDVSVQEVRGIAE
jgi:hypothetical protein